MRELRFRITAALRSVARDRLGKRHSTANPPDKPARKISRFFRAIMTKAEFLLMLISSLKNGFCYEVEDQRFAAAAALRRLNIAQSTPTTRIRTMTGIQGKDE